MANRSSATTIDDYIAEFPPETREALEQVRRVIRETAPEAVEGIAYAIPTFDLDGKHLVHFAGYAHHVGLYPTPSGMVAFEEELAPFRAGKGSARFPLDRPLPLDLVRRVVEFRVGEMRGKARG